MPADYNLRKTKQRIENDRKRQERIDRLPPLEPRISPDLFEKDVIDKIRAELESKSKKPCDTLLKL